MDRTTEQREKEAGGSHTQQSFGAPHMNWDQAREVGQRRQMLNFAVVALLGAFLVGVAFWMQHGMGRFWLALAVGLLYANCFEYFYHRYLLHGFQNALATGHAGHHSHWGRDDEPAHVGFGASPFWVMVILLINSVPFLAAEYLLRWGLAVGVVACFHAYFVLLESIHWRIHVGRLPKGLRWCRQYHFTHHADGDSRFNVFLPLFDLLLGTYKLPSGSKKMGVRYRWQLLGNYVPGGPQTGMQPRSKAA